MSLPAPLTGRIGILDELKGMAIILVILYHAGGVLGLNDTLHFEVGVDIFVILSGVGLTLGTSSGGAGRFLLRRFWRIYPTYWIVLTVFVIAAAVFRGVHYTATDVLLHYLGLHAWFGDAYAMSINDSFWFITLIVTLYLVYAWLRRFAHRADLVLLAGSVVSLAPILLYFHLGQASVFSHMALRIPGFFLGLLIGTMLRTGSVSVPLSSATGAAFLILFYVAYTQGITLVSFLIGLVLMGAYAFLLRPLLPDRACRDLKFLGDRSLGIFLIHQPLIREYNVLVLQRYFPSYGLSPKALTMGMAVGVVVTIFLASWLNTVVQRLPIPGGRRPTAGA